MNHLGIRIITIVALAFIPVTAAAVLVRWRIWRERLMAGVKPKAMMTPLIGTSFALSAITILVSVMLWLHLLH